MEPKIKYDDIEKPHNNNNKYQSRKLLVLNIGPGFVINI